MKKFKSIADISFGVNYPPDKFGDISIIQSRSINEFGDYNLVYNSKVNSKIIGEKDCLKEGDLLFAAKGSNNYPYVVKSRDLPAVASSVFFIIRTNSKRVLPQFLAWYLKTPKARHWIDTISEGSTISSISIREFRKMEVPVPALEVQRRIIKLQELQVFYQTCVEKLAANMELLSNEISKKLIEEKHE